jgi:hypothetical protein
VVQPFYIFSLIFIINFSIFNNLVYKNISFPSKKIFSLIFNKKKQTKIINLYLKPTLACQTKANKKNNTGITGIISVSGLKIAKAPGSLLINNVSIESF